MRPRTSGVFAALLWLGCAHSPHPEGAVAETLQRRPSNREGRADVATQIVTSDCVAVEITDCATVARAPVPSAAASELGLVLDVDGNVTCDPDLVDCAVLGPPEGMVVERLSEACGFHGMALLRTPTGVYVRFPQSVGAQGGPGYFLGRIENADPATYEPLGAMMGRDADAVFDYGSRVPDLDPVTFSAVSPEHGCRGCDAHRCVVDCPGHPLSRPRFCFVPRPESEGTPGDDPTQPSNFEGDLSR